MSVKNRRRTPYRAGPWPGLTAHGAEVLLGWAALLAAALTLVGSPRQPWPDLPLLALASLAPLALATRLTRLPGAAVAVCGAYLLPRTLLSLVVPNLEPPPLLLVPALGFELCLWLRLADLAALRNVWPRGQQPWRKRRPAVRKIGTRRAAISGAVYAALLAVIVPPWTILLGGDPTSWTGDVYALGTAAAVLLGGATGVIARDTES
jgi:hypothetical protein